MATFPGPIRKQKLSERSKEASALRANNDVAKLKDVRSYLKTIITYFKVIIGKLRDFQTSSDDEQNTVEDELERCVEKQRDVSECTDEIRELIVSANDDDDDDDDKTTALLNLEEME